MSQSNLEESAKSLAAMFQAAEPEMVQAIFHIMQLLLKGGPVPAERLASRLHISPDEAAALFHQLRPRGGEFDQDGNMVGFGLTLVPTPYQYQVKDRLFYVWCADEAIMFPAIFGHTAEIESPDPITGEKIQLLVLPEGVKQVEPDTAVVSRRIGVAEDVDNVRGTGCYYGHLFTSPETAAQYVNIHKHVGLEVVPVEDVFQIGQMLLAQESLLRSFANS